MIRFPVKTVIYSMLALPLATLSLLGCGEEYQSTDEFLSGLPIDSGADDTAVGTMPPIGESLENVARIRLEIEEYDMGVVANDKLSHGKIKVYNDGKMPLKITRIDTTCACTQGQVTEDRAIVEGGGETWIDVVIDPRRIPGFHSRKVLSITSTDLANPTVEVGVTVTVDPEFEIGPETIAVGQIPQGTPLEERIRFRQLIEKPVNILELRAVSPSEQADGEPDLRAEVVAVPEEEWQTPGRPEHDLVFTFSPELPVGAFTRYALLTTDTRGGRHQLRLTFTGEVVAPDGAAPAVEEAPADE